MLDKLTETDTVWLTLAAIVAVVLIVSMVTNTISSFSKHAYEDDDADSRLGHLEKLAASAQDMYALLELMATDLARSAAALEQLDAHFETAEREIAGIRMRDVGSTDPELIESMRSIIREGGQP